MNRSIFQMVQRFSLAGSHTLLLFAFIGIILFGVPVTKTLADEKRPYWSAEFKLGQFHPNLDDWDRFYSDDNMNQYSVALAYKVLRQLEIGLEASYMSEDGRGVLPLNNQVGGEVDYTLVPVSAYIILRAIFSENQLVVPYVGGGVTRMSYKQNVTAGDETKGNTNGIYYKAGIQLLLDRIDLGAAQAVQRDFGVDNTYLFFEFAKTTAKIDDTGGNEVDLGGQSYFLGLLLEF
ncbi:hypothetical protein MNBD_GAMMA16-454 [hydrothermal vent metagenome]|uniref:Outer membrane protein beta-barrel domain-containing protein n=1 Tax=hydrothermal vent metagenome TaxID=652676 RepID=A0A3B0Z2H8_9ZZZZ